MRTNHAIPTNLAAMAIASLTLPGVAAAQTGGPYDLSWNTSDCGGGVAVGGVYELMGVIGQPDAGPVNTGANFVVAGGFLPGAATVCYANCDASTSIPVLNVNDFICFQARFAAGDPYANCDGSTTPPILNVNDFICFQGRFASGCP